VHIVDTAGSPVRLQAQGQALDARALAAELSRELSGEVRFDGGSRSLYATDASNYRQVPIHDAVLVESDRFAAFVGGAPGADDRRAAGQGAQPGRGGEHLVLVSGTGVAGAAI
jgi:hypothetical protein